MALISKLSEIVDEQFKCMMKMLLLSNLYPNSLERNRATFNKRQFYEFSRWAEVCIIAQIAWTDLLRLKLQKGRFVPFREVIDGIEVFHPIYFFSPKMFSFLSGFFCFFSIFATASKLIRKQKPDCIFATWAYPDGFAAILLGKVFSLPVFIKVHGSDIHSIQSKIVEKLTVWSLQRAKKVFSVSNDLKHRMVKMGVAKNAIITVYNGVDLNVFYPHIKNKIREKYDIPPHLKVLLYVGNLEYVKGPDVLLDALRIIKQSQSGSSDFVLYFTGNGSLQSELQKRCRQYGMEKNICFYGKVAHADMAEWMNIADLLIVPSRNEGVPNVILEAMACELPVVATQVGGIPEVVLNGWTGLLVPSENLVKLASAINAALNTKWNYGAIAKQAEQFSWPKNASVVIREIELFLSNVPSN